MTQRDKSGPPTWPAGPPGKWKTKLTISGAQTGRYSRDLELVEQAKAEVAAMTHVPSLEEVHEFMSKFPGSLAEDFMAERDNPSLAPLKLNLL